MQQLPSWCSAAAGRALVQAIILSPPSYFIVVDEYGVEHHTYRGKEAAKLRRMHDRALTVETDRANERYAAGTSWDQASVELMRLYREETPDRLIARLSESGAVAVRKVA